MKRIAKVDSILGVSLEKNNGFHLILCEEDVLKKGICKKEGKEYNYILTKGNNHIYYRDTNCFTYYEADTCEIDDYSDYIIEEKEECVNVETQGDIDLLEKQCFTIDNFYKANFNTYYEIENEVCVCFGFSNGDGNIYIPRGSEGNGEKCVVYGLSEINPDWIKTKKEFDGILCSLKRDKNKVNTKTFELKYDIPGFDTVSIIKQNVDRVIDFNSHTAFVRNNLITYLEEYVNPEFTFFTVTTIPSVPNIDNYTVLYKAYKKNKKTRGITDSIKADMFEYLKY